MVVGAGGLQVPGQQGAVMGAHACKPSTWEAKAGYYDWKPILSARFCTSPPELSSSMNDDCSQEY